MTLSKSKRDCNSCSLWQEASITDVTMTFIVVQFSWSLWRMLWVITSVQSSPMFSQCLQAWLGKNPHGHTARSAGCQQLILRQWWVSTQAYSLCQKWAVTDVFVDKSITHAIMTRYVAWRYVMFPSTPSSNNSILYITPSTLITNKQQHIAQPAAFTSVFIAWAKYREGGIGGTAWLDAIKKHHFYVACRNLNSNNFVWYCMRDWCFLWVLHNKTKSRFDNCSKFR